MFPARQRKAQQGSTARHSAARHNMQSRRCNPIMRSAEACCCIQTGCVEMVQGGCKRTTRLAWHCKLLLVPRHLRKAVVDAYAGLVLYWHAGCCCLAAALTTATSCRMSAASAILPSPSFIVASRRVRRARSISTKICNTETVHGSSHLSGMSLQVQLLNLCRKGTEL